MAFPVRAVALIAALAPGMVHAQPIVSPRQVAESNASQPAKSAGSPKSPSSSKTAAPSKAAAISRTRTAATSPSQVATSPGTAKPASKAMKAKPKPAKRGDASQARFVAPAKRGPRGDNMPLGFAWPPSAAMRAASTACEDELTALGVSWKHAAPEGHIAAPIELTDEHIAGIKYTSKWRRPPHTLDCQLARALAQVGAGLYALGVREVRWGSIYRWSNVRTQGREFPALSRHALGLAMDIVEFIDDSGRVANVEQHYPLGDPLLLAIEQAANASGRFRIVLTPRNDPASHHDHFHIEANPSYLAR